MALWFITLTLTLTLEVLNPVDHSRTAAVHGCTNVACKERRRNGFVRLLQDTADAFESNRSLGTMHGVQVTLTLCLTLTTDPNPNPNPDHDPDPSPTPTPTPTPTPDPDPNPLTLTL